MTWASSGLGGFLWWLRGGCLFVFSCQRFKVIVKNDDILRREHQRVAFYRARQPDPSAQQITQGRLFERIFSIHMKEKHFVAVSLQARLQAFRSGALIVDVQA